MHALCCFAVGAAFGRKSSGKSEVSNPLLTSAPSRGPRTQSVLAFTPSWPRKTLFKRESPVTHHLVSRTFAPLTELAEVGKKPVWGPLCIADATGFGSTEKLIPSIPKHLVLKVKRGCESEWGEAPASALTARFTASGVNTFLLSEHQPQCATSCGRGAVLMSPPD